MSIAELLVPELDHEIGVTREVLKRVPDDRGEWKPHAKAFPLAHLAQLVARLPGVGADDARPVRARHLAREWSEVSRLLDREHRYQMLRTMVLNHHIHHRAQLGMYLRLLDEKVPPMYGPTADG